MVAARSRVRDFFETFLLAELIKGMALTGRNLSRGKMTVQYPDERRGDLILTKPTLLAVGDRYEREVARDRGEDAAFRRVACR